MSAAEVVFLLCGAVSSLCAALLIRSYRRNRTRLLLHGCLCFSGLALANVLLFVDLALYRELDLLPVRQLITFVSATLLVWGLIWDAR